MKRATRASMVAFGVGVAGAMAMGTTALAFPGDDWFPGILCPDVWMPVLCPDGNVYSNDCYALRAGQKNCVPLWGPIPVPM